MDNTQKLRKILVNFKGRLIYVDDKIRLVPISYTNEINTCTSSSIYDTR